MDLSARHGEVQRPTFAVDNRVDFRGPTAPADADRLIFLPPFPPLAARWAFTMVLSIRYRLSRDFDASRVEDTLPDAPARPAVEPIISRCVRPVAFRQIAPRHTRAQHVKDRIHDPAIVNARALSALRHQRLEKCPFLIAQIKSHDPPPRTVNYVRSNYSIIYLGTDPSHAELVFRFNGLQLGNSFIASNPGEWLQFSAAWDSGSNTNLTLAILDLNTNANGNDFALDDIGLVPISAVPSIHPLSCSSLVFGLLGLLAWRRKRRGAAAIAAYCVRIRYTRRGLQMSGDPDFHIIGVKDVMAWGDDSPADVHLLGSNKSKVFLRIELSALRNLRDKLNEKYPKAKDRKR